jgi:superfamily II DNA or RNA helicase
MSLSIEISELSERDTGRINKDLTIKIENKFQKGGMPKIVTPYAIRNERIYLPFAYAKKVIKLSRPKRNVFPSVKLKFSGKLRKEQKIVRKEALEKMSSNGSVIISGFPGFGKTITAINISLVIGFKTLIIVNKIVLIKQWNESILKFCPGAKIQKLNSKSTKEEADFYIINAQNAEKMGKNFFSDVGLCVVDEAHMIMAECLARALQYISPRYILALTATPYRPDGLDIMLELYFGKHKIIRELVKKHTVYKISTGFMPPVERNIQGRLNWGSILDAQATNESRNDSIIEIIQKFSERNILVLIKRISQGKYLLEKLQDLGESVTDLMGSKQEFDREARILIGTCQKVGVGFDHDKLDCLLLATDIEEYFIQYLGRVFRRKEVEPIIFDFVDENNTLKKHFRTRQAVYRKHGGTIKNYVP